MKDILILTADKCAELTMKALMNRMPKSENIAEFCFDVITHPKRDPGIANQAVEYVRPYIGDYRFLLVIFDHEGSGMENYPRIDLESHIESELNQNGWQDRNACILLEPELESWLWVNKTHLHRVMEWRNEQDIYSWLEMNGFNSLPTIRKPERPKEAFESALRFQKIPFSAALYSGLAQQASYKDCVDPSFKKLVSAVRNWFSEAS